MRREMHYLLKFSEPFHITLIRKELGALVTIFQSDILSDGATFYSFPSQFEVSERGEIKRTA